MKFEIVNNPVGMIDFVLDNGDMINAEAASLVYMSDDIAIETKKRRGGLLKTLKTTMLAGESFFMNEYRSRRDGTRLGITGNAVGDMHHIHVEDGEYFIQSGSFVCSTAELTLDTQWQGFKKGLFGTNLFMLKTVGGGTLFVDGWGGVRRLDLGRGETVKIDNYQIVAFTGADYDVIKLGSLKTTIFGGDALVTKFTGPGTVYYSTKNPMELARALRPFLSSNNSNATSSVVGGLIGAGIGLKR